MSNISVNATSHCRGQGRQCSVLIAFKFIPLFIVSLALMGGVVTAKAETIEQTELAQKVTNVTKIRITIADKQIIATLDDNAAARDFLSLLPLSLNLNDFNKTEKISGLPRRLSTEGTPAGFDPDAGDITYYAPWGNLAIFYRDFKYSPGLVSLGRIDSGLDSLKQQGELTALIERVD